MPLAITSEGVRIAVRLQPAAGANCIDGIDETAGGERRLRVRVTAAPAQGKANAALIKLLAKTWRVAPSSIEVVGGAKDRNKLLLVRGEPDAVHAQIAGRIGALDATKPTRT